MSGKCRQSEKTAFARTTVSGRMRGTPFHICGIFWRLLAGAALAVTCPRIPPQGGARFPGKNAMKVFVFDQPVGRTVMLVEPTPSVPSGHFLPRLEMFGVGATATSA